MDIQEQIKSYLESQDEPKRSDLEALHQLIRQIAPNNRLWFLDGKDDTGKVVTNPNIGYGQYVIHYKSGLSKTFYQIGISANTTGISVYIMGLEDKKYLAENVEKTIGKAKVTGYCIKFKTLKDINIDILKNAIHYGFEQSKTPKP